MKQFEKVTQSVEVLAEFLSSENKGDNDGCPGCAEFENCTGKETCRSGWVDFLNSEVEDPEGDNRQVYMREQEIIKIMDNQIKILNDWNQQASEGSIEDIRMNCETMAHLVHARATASYEARNGMSLE